MLDDILATIQKKLKRICYELLKVLDGDPFEIVELRELFQKMSRVENELVGCMGDTVPEGVKQAFADFSMEFEKILDSSAQTNETTQLPLRTLVQKIYDCLGAFNLMMVLLCSNEQLVQGQELIIIEQSELSSTEAWAVEEITEEDLKEEDSEKEIRKEPMKAIDSKEEFARLIALLGELRMSSNAFQNLSHQALAEYNLPLFSKEIRVTRNSFGRVLEKVEESVMGLCHRYTDLVYHKSKVLPFETSDQAFIIDVNQVLEVLKVPHREVFKRRGRFFYNFRGETIGIIFLAELYGTAFTKRDPMGIVVITDGRTKLGLVVERWSVEQEVLVELLADIFLGQKEISGAAVMENGQISLRLDGVALIKRVLQAGEQEE
ncbi:hypothetical protein SBF1_3340004 [Candidatus Desulfosporosinus infrequens]|uniref:CheW-like domain-containing protein n=1 Tax=Candidatus Desulfosporosinus infrequens TaxID=2043169 RepID=A0A2U3L0S1_9FIRM|nr:hypothetical protein SBF1_3340004 [Candidatus Desulfosporosinus infrequens]